MHDGRARSAGTISARSKARMSTDIPLRSNAALIRDSSSAVLSCHTHHVGFVPADSPPVAVSAAPPAVSVPVPAGLDRDGAAPPRAAPARPPAVESAPRELRPRTTEEPNPGRVAPAADSTGPRGERLAAGFHRPSSASHTFAMPIGRSSSSATGSASARAAALSRATA